METGQEIRVEVKVETVVPPSEWRVVFHNDDTTPVSLIVYILKEVFRYEESQAVGKALDIERKGRDVVGVYTRSIAETKQGIALDMARNAGYETSITIEKDE